MTSTLLTSAGRISGVSSIPGTGYNPSSSDLSILSLQALRTANATAISALNTAKSQAKTAINNREALFAPLETLTRRIQSAARSAGATSDQQDDIEEIARKIKGDRAGTKSPDPVNPGDPHSISVSQQSFVNLAAHFSSLLSLLAEIPAYAPNEEDLKLTTLQTLHANMEILNTDAGNKEIAETNARNARNAAMYADDTGLVAIAARVKDYVFSSTDQGAKTPYYKNIKGIPFTRNKK